MSESEQNPAEAGKPKFWQTTKYSHLIRHVASGQLYLNARIAGKLVRRSLRTDKLTVARLRLDQSLRELREAESLRRDVSSGRTLTLRNALDVLRERIDADPATRMATKRFYAQTLDAIGALFPNPERDIRQATADDCAAWSRRFAERFGCSRYNVGLSVLRKAFAVGVERGFTVRNVAEALKRQPIRHEKPNVPTREQFRTLVAAIRQSDGRLDSQAKSKPAADLVELLAFSGMRIGEARELRWRDVDFETNTLTVTGGGRGTKSGRFRVIPMNDALRGLLARLHAEQQPQPADRVTAIADAKTAIISACRRAGLPHCHHHDFRHFFATTCIEAGVDIPTVSRWLGHADGGALAMRVYGHLRDAHSQEQAKRLRFDADTPTPASNVVPLDPAESA
jgi:integrase